VLLRFSVKEQLLLVSLFSCFVNFFLTLVIAFLKLLSGSSESLAHDSENIYGHILKKMGFTSLFVYLPFRAVYNPLQDFYWHKIFHRPLSANSP